MSKYVVNTSTWKGNKNESSPSIKIMLDPIKTNI